MSNVEKLSVLVAALSFFSMSYISHQDELPSEIIINMFFFSFSVKTVCARTARGLAILLENAPMWPFATIVVFLGEYVRHRC